jgi:hypothetical protein
MIVGAGGRIFHVLGGISGAMVRDIDGGGSNRHAAVLLLKVSIVCQ